MYRGSAGKLRTAAGAGAREGESIRVIERINMVRDEALHILYAMKPGVRLSEDDVFTLAARSFRVLDPALECGEIRAALLFFAGKAVAMAECKRGLWKISPKGSRMMKRGDAETPTGALLREGMIENVRRRLDVLRDPSKATDPMTILVLDPDHGQWARLELRGKVWSEIEGFCKGYGLTYEDFLARAIRHKLDEVRRRGLMPVGVPATAAA